jgi:hypothetical protein
MPDLTQMLPRPFPWYCPNCRQKEVWRTTIPYQCQRLYQGKSITVIVANLAIPKCKACAELVFDYEAEEQVNQSYRSQTAHLGNGLGGVSSPAQPAGKQEHA